MTGLELPVALADAVLAHARAELPNEACGLLGGDPATGRVGSWHPARNALMSPRRFDVHPEDLVRITFEIEDAGEALLAIFHSHPRSPAVPSPTDLRDAAYPAVHLLATLVDPHAPPADVLRAWRFTSGGSVEVSLRIF